MSRKKKTEEDIFREEVGDLRNVWRSEGNGVRPKQRFFKRFFDLLRPRLPELPTGYYDFYYVLENDGGLVYRAAQYAPGKEPCSYKVTESAWSMEVTEDGTDYMRIGKCPLMLTPTPQHLTLLSNLIKHKDDRHVFHVIVLRITRAYPRQRMFRVPDPDYAERLPFVGALRK